MEGSLNMMSITVEQFIDEVEMQLEEENYNPMFGLGKPGVGKTMSIAEICKKRGIGFCELRLVTLTEVDMLGIPIIENGRTTYASNALLPDAKRDGEEGILVLDEITSCSSTIRAAAYQLLDSKRALGNYKLPDKWKVVCLGNGAEDGGVFTGMESAFMSRCVCFRIEPDLDCWKKWAINNGIHPTIPAFLTFDKDWFHKLNVDEIASIFPCPRSWMALSKMLNAREQKKGRVLTDTEVTILAAGAVGVDAATPFATFYKFSEDMEIDVDDIISGKAVKEEGQIGNRKFSCTLDLHNIEREKIYLAIQQLGKAAFELFKDFDIRMPDDKQLPYVKATVNMLKWLLAIGEIRKDYAIAGIQDIQQNIDSIQYIVTANEEFDELLPEFTNFAVENGNIF